MFASKDLFDDNDEGEGQSPGEGRLGTAATTVTRPSMSQDEDDDSEPESFRPISRQASTPMDERPTTAGGDENSNPAMRRQKMMELRQAQLDKHKAKKQLGGMIRTAEGPKVNTGLAKSVGSPIAPSPVSSPKSAGGNHGNNNNYNSNNNNITNNNGTYTVITSGSTNNNNNQAASTGTNGQSTSQQGEPDGGIQSLLNEKRAEKEGKQLSQVEREMMAHGITPIFDPVKKPVDPRAAPQAKLDFSDMRNFLTSPIPKGTVLQCYINRNKKGLKNKMYPKYELYMEDGDRFLLASTKRSKNKTSNYVISMDNKNLTKESASYLGKVRSNFVGTEFVCYDKGINPKEVDSDNASISMMTVRQELCAVFYESNILGHRGPRKMIALVPSVRKDGSRGVWRPMKTEDSIIAKYKEGNTGDMSMLQNKTPKWNDQVGAYVLNFNGRVRMASVKNFQLIFAEDPENVVLQFGRVGKDTFTMDIGYPLSPLQAFAMCLSSFDYKIACE